MTHWTCVDSTFLLRGVANMYGLKLRAGWVVQLFGPNGVVITTLIRGVQTSGSFAYQSIFGVMVQGFDEKVTMDNWLVAIHEPSPL